MKYYLVAGEASGDLHASNLMKSIARRDNSAQFRCFGGDMMEAAGGKLVIGVDIPDAAAADAYVEHALKEFLG